MELAIIIASFFCISGVILYTGWWRLRPDYVTRHGLVVYLHGYKMSQDSIEKETTRFALEQNNGDASIVMGWELHWKPQPFSVRGVKYNGASWPNRQLIWVGWKERIEETAYYHELEHLIKGSFH